MLAPGMARSYGIELEPPLQVRPRRPPFALSRALPPPPPPPSPPVPWHLADRQFFIEAVLDTRPSPTPPTREYHIKWADYSSECNTWETLAGLFDTEGQCVAFLEHCFNNGLLSPGEATVEAIAFVGGSGLPSSGDDDGDDGVEGAGDSEEDQDDDDDDSNEDEGDESDDDEEDDINDEAEDDEVRSDADRICFASHYYYLFHFFLFSFYPFSTFFSSSPISPTLLNADLQHHRDYIADVLGSRTTNGHTEYLVQWEGDAYSEAHWMTLEDLMADLDERAEFVAQWAGRMVLVKKPEAEAEGGAEAEPEGADGFNTVGSSASASSEHELSQPAGVDEDQEGDEEDAQGEDAHDEEYDDDDDTEVRVRPAYPHSHSASLGLNPVIAYPFCPFFFIYFIFFLLFSVS
jgi:hypothetical protein